MPTTVTPTVHLRDIVVIDRGRQTLPNIPELAESIKQYGVFTPLCVTPIPDQPGKYWLVAGGRRYQASLLAGLAEVPVNIVELSLLKRRQIELEENVQRVDLHWSDQCIMMENIDAARKAEDKTWTQAKTAELVGVSTGGVSDQIKFAKDLRERPDIKEQVQHLPYVAARKQFDAILQNEKMERLSASGQIKLITDFKEGSCVDLIKGLANGCIDLMVTDPPYGLAKLESLRDSNVSGSRLQTNHSMTGHTMMSEHHNSDIVTVCKMLKTLQPEFHRVMKPGAHFYMFCAFQYIGNFIEALSPLLEFQPPVLIWNRGKPSTPGFGYNYLPYAEVIIYGHNTPRTKRLRESRSNIFDHPDVPSDLRCYPTEKPEGLLKMFMEQSSITGDTVFDPFAGSASTLAAARSLGRRAIGFEINHDSWLVGQRRLKEVK